MLYYYGGTIIPDTNNNFTYINRSTMFMNAITDMSFEDIKKVICGRLRLNYNDIKINITWRSLVKEH
jgi:hypothetical protein